MRKIGSNTIIYDNYFPLRKRVFLLERKVKYVEDILVTRNTENLDIPRKEVIRVIYDKG